MNRETTTLADLVREVVTDKPMNHCADNGVTCIFCGAYWSNINGIVGKPPITHDDDCWILRASAALAALDSE